VNFVEIIAIRIQDSIGAVGQLVEPEPVEHLFEPGPELPFEKTRQPIYRRSHEELFEGDGHGLVDVR
jgi:hypothetical protein